MLIRNKVEVLAPDSRRRVYLFFNWIFPGMFVALGAIILHFGLGNVQRSHSSLSWPQADGIIKFSTLGRHSGNSGSTYSGDVSYDYTLGGTTYSSSRVSFGQYGSSDSSHARSVVNRYPVGRTVQVSYSPDDYSLSVLEPGGSISDWFLPAGGALFFICGSFLLGPRRAPPLQPLNADSGVTHAS